MEPIDYGTFPLYVCNCRNSFRDELKTSLKKRIRIAPVTFSQQQKHWNPRWLVKALFDANMEEWLGCHA
jgi:hypothetical protein